MRTVILSLKRQETKLGRRNLPTAGAIVRRDRERSHRARRVSRVRGIPEDRIGGMTEELSIYAEGKRERVFKAFVVRQDRMFELLGIQPKAFNRWLARGNVPHALFCIYTGKKGFPPKAYLIEEAQSLVTALNAHYNEHSTFRDTDVGLRRNVHAALNLCRGRKIRQYANSCK